MNKRPTYHLPPKQNFTHLDDSCRNPNCVFGWLDHFEGDDQYVTTTACHICRPQTYAFLRMFPNVGNRDVNVLHQMEKKRQELKAKRGGKNEF